MDLLLKKLLDNNIFYDVFLKRGVDYFVQSIPIISYQKNDKLTINSTCNRHKSSIVINENNLEILKKNCDCESFKKYKGFCTHIVAMLYQYAYEETIKNIDKFSTSESYKISFLVDAFNNKIILTPQLNIYSKPHNIFDISSLFENKIVFEANDSKKEIFFDQISPKISGILYHLIFESKMITKFNNKSFILDKDKFYIFLKYCWENNIDIYNEKDKTKLVSIEYSTKEFIKDKIEPLFFNKSIFVKKNYNNLFCCKTDFVITEHFCELEKSIFFLYNPSEKYSLIHIVDSPDTYEKCRNFYWQFNHGSNKNDFINLYNYLEKNFKQFNLYFDEQVLIKHNLLNRNPQLLLELRYNENVLNPVLTLKFVYLDKYYYWNDNITDIENRSIEKEQKLLKKISKFLTIFSEKYNCYIFNNKDDFYKLISWMKINKNDENFIIKIAKNLVFKTKTKTKFYVNNLSKKDDLLFVDWQLNNYSQNDIKLIVNSYIQKQEFVKLSNGEIIDLLNDIDFDDFRNQLKLFNSNFNDFLNNNVQVKKWNYLLLSDKFHDNFEIKNFINSFKNIDSVSLNLSKNLIEILKPYQLYGIKWLKLHFTMKTGSILADEMGLGKTLQSIGFLSDYFYCHKNATCIVVAPSSLIYNWKKEFEVYSNHLKICVIDGNIEKRSTLLKKMDKYDVIIISYNLLKINVEDFKNKQFNIMIIDEGHTIKNRFTKFAKAIMSIKADHKIALTGTPMENNTLELWSLFNFIMPGFLNDFNSFKKFISDSSEDNYKILQNKISPFILRRTKKDVLKELPDKIEKLMYIDFNSEQEILYSNLLQSIRQDIDKSILEKDVEKNKIFILSLLTKLRQLCCSPKLLYENAKTNGNKFNVCMSLIEEIIERNEKVLVFSQFTEMLSFFQKELYSKNIDFLTITGSTSKKDRQNLVELFNKNNSAKVFLISLKAGGVGLNLTSASNVIHYDLWWNVSVENQASDRVHRIGQKNNVTIYKLIMNNSIEKKIIEIQDSKKDLINKILDFSKIENEEFSMKKMLKILGIKKFD